MPACWHVHRHPIAHCLPAMRWRTCGCTRHSRTTFSARSEPFAPSSRTHTQSLPTSLRRPCHGHADRLDRLPRPSLAATVCRTRPSAGPRMDLRRTGRLGGPSGGLVAPAWLRRWRAARGAGAQFGVAGGPALCLRAGRRNLCPAQLALERQRARCAAATRSAVRVAGRRCRGRSHGHGRPGGLYRQCRCTGTCRHAIDSTGSCEPDPVYLRHLRSAQGRDAQRAKSAARRA